MKYSQLIEQIGTEARISGDTGFQALVISLLNELFKEAVESQRPMELREEAYLDLTTDVGFVILPDDFFVHHQVQFVDADTGKKYPLTDQDKAAPPAPRGMYGHPKTFEIMSGVVNIKPADSVVTGDKLFLVYYKTPPIITVATLATDNPIPRVEPFLIRAAIRRIRMFHADDLQVAQLLGGDISSAASSYTKDEPVRNSRSN